MPSSPRQLRYANEFKRCLHKLSKRFRRIKSDVQPILDRILAGECPGDRVTATGMVIYKVRVPNSDARHGTRGGYRILYYVATQQLVVLLTIYSKTDTSDIPTKRLLQIIAEYETTHN